MGKTIKTNVDGAFKLSIVVLQAKLGTESTSRHPRGDIKATRCGQVEAVQLHPELGFANDSMQTVRVSVRRDRKKQTEEGRKEGLTDWQTLYSSLRHRGNDEGFRMPEYVPFRGIKSSSLSSPRSPRSDREGSFSGPLKDLRTCYSYSGRVVILLMRRSGRCAACKR